MSNKPPPGPIRPLPPPTPALEGSKVRVSKQRGGVGTGTRDDLYSSTQVQLLGEKAVCLRKKNFISHGIVSA